MPATRRTRPRGGNQRIAAFPVVISAEKRPTNTTCRREPMSTAMSKVRTALVIGGAESPVPSSRPLLLKAEIQATVYEATPTLAEGIGGGPASWPPTAWPHLSSSAPTMPSGPRHPGHGHGNGERRARRRLPQPGGRGAAPDRRPRATCTGAPRPAAESASASSTVSARSEPSKARIRSRRSSTTAAPRPPTSRSRPTACPLHRQNPDRPGSSFCRLHRTAQLPGLHQRRPRHRPRTSCHDVRISASARTTCSGRWRTAA